MQNDIPKVGFLVNFTAQEVKNWGFFAPRILFFGSRSSVHALRFMHFVSRSSVLGLVTGLLGCMKTWNIGNLEQLLSR